MLRPSLRHCALSLVGLFFVAGCGDALHGHAHHDDLVAFHAEGDALARLFRVDRDGLGYVLDAIEIEDPHFDRVGFRFDADATPEVDARVSADGGETWSRWVPAEITWSEGSIYNAHADVPHGGSHVQLRLRDLEPEAFTFLAVDSFVFEPDPIADPEDLAELATQAQALAAHTGVDVTRSQWGARATRCSTRHSPYRITVHHTVTPNNDSNMPARVRGIQNYHMDNRGWCDIGYQFLVGQDGKVYQGRMEYLLGTHVGNNNSGNLGVSFIGTFSTVVPSNGMFNAGARILRSIRDYYGITLNRTNVKGHREYNSTACPGQELYNRLGHLIDLANGGGGGGSTGNGTLRGAIFWGTNFDQDINDSSKRISGATVRLNTGATTTTDSNGNYAFSVAAGTYTVTASATGYSTESITRTVTSGDTTWGSIMLTQETSKGEIRGAIYHGDDLQNLANRISGATVRLNTGQTATTDGEGWYRFEIEPGTYTITASASGYSTESISRDVTAGNTSWGSIKLTAQQQTTTGTVRGAVFWGESADDFAANLQDESKRISGATVTFSPGGQTTTTGSDGWYEIDLAPGTYTVTASASGYTTTQRPDPVTVGADATSWGSTMVIKETASGDDSGSGSGDSGSGSGTGDSGSGTGSGNTNPEDPGDTGTEPSPVSGVFGFIHDAFGGDTARIGGALVRIGEAVEVLTDASGAFDVDVDPGTYPIVVQAEGFASYFGAVTVLEETRIRLRIGLEAAGTDVGAVTITFPAHGDIVTEARVLVTGTWDHEAMGIIEVNGVEAMVDADGTFAVEIELMPGENVIEAALRDLEGDIAATTSVVVHLEASARRGFGCSTAGGSSADLALFFGLLGAVFAAGRRRRR
jgi:MYXO-CTERM domain-containing protein